MFGTRQYLPGFLKPWGCWRFESNDDVSNELMDFRIFVSISGLLTKSSQQITMDICCLHVANAFRNQMLVLSYLSSSPSFLFPRLWNRQTVCPISLFMWVDIKQFVRVVIRLLYSNRKTGLHNQMLSGFRKCIRAHITNSSVHMKPSTPNAIRISIFLFFRTILCYRSSTCAIQKEFYPSNTPR